MGIQAPGSAPQVAFQGAEGERLAERDDPLAHGVPPISLSRDADESGVKIQVVGVQAHDFLSADAAGDQKRHDGPVTRGEPARDPPPTCSLLRATVAEASGGKERGQLLLVKGRRGLFLGLFDTKPTGWIALQEAGGDEVLEKGPQFRQCRCARDRTVAPLLQQPAQVVSDVLRAHGGEVAPRALPSGEHHQMRVTCLESAGEQRAVLAEVFDVADSGLRDARERIRLRGLLLNGRPVRAGRRCEASARRGRYPEGRGQRPVIEEPTSGVAGGHPPYAP